MELEARSARELATIIKWYRPEYAEEVCWEISVNVFYSSCVERGSDWAAYKPREFAIFKIYD